MPTYIRVRESHLTPPASYVVSSTQTFKLGIIFFESNESKTLRLLCLRISFHLKMKFLTLIKIRVSVLNSYITLIGAIFHFTSHPTANQDLHSFIKQNAIS